MVLTGEGEGEGAWRWGFKENRRRPAWRQEARGSFHDAMPGNLAFTVSFQFYFYSQVDSSAETECGLTLKRSASGGNGFRGGSWTRRREETASPSETLEVRVSAAISFVPRG